MQIPSTRFSEGRLHVNEYNGMPADQVGATQWRKSTYSGVGNCVELARLASGEVAMRNSRFPEGPALLCPPEGFAAFLDAAKRGDLDELLS